MLSSAVCTDIWMLAQFLVNFNFINCFVADKIFITFHPVLNI